MLPIVASSSYVVNSSQLVTREDAMSNVVDLFKVKICTKCKETKLITDFNKHCYAKEGIRSTCKNCENKYNMIYRIKNKIKIKKKYQEYWHAADTDKQRHAILIIQHLKRKCRQRGIKFNLKASDIIIPNYCPALGIKLVRGNGNNGISVDRINPKKGYTRGNIIVVSRLANQIKSNATCEQLVKVANWMETHK